jgi:hypothetical protein
MFISCHKPKDMQKMSLDDLTYIVGLVINKNIIKPPKCKIDGEYVFIDINSGFYQCEYCGRFGKLYMGDSLDDFSNWGELDAKYFE